METKKKRGFSFDRFRKKKKPSKRVSLDHTVSLSPLELRKTLTSEKVGKFASANDISQRSNIHHRNGHVIHEEKVSEPEFTMDDEGSMCLWADTMTTEQITECKYAFAQFDKNGDGCVPWKDFGKILRTLGQNPTETELEDIRIDRILQSGTNGTGAIDFPEFITIIAKRFGIDGADEMEKAFRAFDENGDGLISFAEFKSYNQKIGQFLTDEEIEEIIKEVDIDGDGYLNYEEFVRMNMR